MEDVKMSWASFGDIELELEALEEAIERLIASQDDYTYH